MQAVLLLFRPLPNVGIQNFGMWSMYNLAKAYRSIKNPLPIAESRTGKEANNGHTKDTIRLFHGPWHDPVGEHICVQPFRMWNRPVSIHFFAGLTNISKTQKRCKLTGLWNEVKFDMSIQSTPKTIGILTKLHVFCTSGPNLVVLALTGDELSRRQAQNGVNFDFEVKFDLECQGQSPPKTIGILRWIPTKK